MPALCLCLSRYPAYRIRSAAAATEFRNSVCHLSLHLQNNSHDSHSFRSLAGCGIATLQRHTVPLCILRIFVYIVGMSRLFRFVPFDSADIYIYTQHPCLYTGISALHYINGLQIEALNLLSNNVDMGKNENLYILICLRCVCRARWRLRAACHHHTSHRVLVLNAFARRRALAKCYVHECFVSACVYVYLKDCSKFMPWIIHINVPHRTYTHSTAAASRNKVLNLSNGILMRFITMIWSFAVIIRLYSLVSALIHFRYVRVYAHTAHIAHTAKHMHFMHWHCSCPKTESVLADTRSFWTAAFGNSTLQAQASQKLLHSHSWIPKFVHEMNNGNCRIFRKCIKMCRLFFLSFILSLFLSLPHSAFAHTYM